MVVIRSPSHARPTNGPKFPPRQVTIVVSSSAAVCVVAHRRSAKRAGRTDRTDSQVSREVGRVRRRSTAPRLLAGENVAGGTTLVDAQRNRSTQRTAIRCTSTASGGDSPPTRRHRAEENAHATHGKRCIEILRPARALSARSRSSAPGPSRSSRRTDRSAGSRRRSQVRGWHRSHRSRAGTRPAWSDSQCGFPNAETT